MRIQSILMRIRIPVLGPNSNCSPALAKYLARYFVEFHDILNSNFMETLAQIKFGTCGRPMGCPKLGPQFLNLTSFRLNTKVVHGGEGGAIRTGKNSVRKLCKLVKM